MKLVLFAGSLLVLAPLLELLQAGKIIIIIFILVLRFLTVSVLLERIAARLQQRRLGQGWLVRQGQSFDREELTHWLESAVVLHLIILGGVHEYLRKLLCHGLQNLAVLFDFVKILHHQEFIQNESQRVDDLVLVSLALVGWLVGSLYFDLSDDQLDDDFECPLVVHDEASLRTLGLMPLQGFL